MPPQKVNILEAATKQITGIFQPHIVADINDAQIKVAKFGEVFDWHARAAEDEGFFVLEGRIAIDFRFNNHLSLLTGPYQTLGKVYLFQRFFSIAAIYHICVSWISIQTK